MIWDAIVFGDEAAVEPTPEWISATLADAPSRVDAFICLLRDASDQMNAIADHSRQQTVGGRSRRNAGCIRCG
ncbi:MAG: hypothetical protein WBA68_01440 [Alteraurantiacibacter sp.]